ASLLLITTACDKGGDAKDGAKKGDDKAAEGGEKTEVAQPEEGGEQPEPAEGGAVEDKPADTGAAAAEAGEPAAGETGGEVAAAEAGGEEGGDKDGGEKEGGEVDKPKPDTKPDKKPPKDGGETATAPKIDAKGIFDGKCKSCHGADGKGDTTIGKKVNIPSLAKTSLSKAKIVSIVEAGVPDTKMKGYKDKLSKEEIDA